MDDPTAAFAELVQLPEPEVALDRACLLIAAHAYPDLDVEEELSRLDSLAARCPERSFDGWHRYLFEDLRFSGSVENYYDPANSFLNEVVRRRVGLPITLSVLGIEIGRRLGVALAGVGMPGHFLLVHGHPSRPVWVDPFAGGRILDRGACEERFHMVNGPSTPFLDAYLEPVGPRAILTRILANLKSIYASRGNLEALAWVYGLRLAIPGTPPLERREFAQVLGSTGRFVAAAETLEGLADVVPGQAEALLAEAQAFRARLN